MVLSDTDNQGLLHELQNYCAFPRCSNSSSFANLLATHTLTHTHTHTQTHTRARVCAHARWPEPILPLFGYRCGLGRHQPSHWTRETPTEVDGHVLIRTLRQVKHTHLHPNLRLRPNVFHTAYTTDTTRAASRT